MTVYLEDKRTDFADVAGKIQHLVGGFPLLVLGFGKLREGEEIPVALLEITIGAVVILTFLLELRTLRRKRRHPGEHHSHSALGWFDLAAGVLLLFEAFHSPHTKPAWQRPQFLSGVVTLGLGLFHGRFHEFRRRRRFLRVDDHGVECRRGRFRRFTIAWDELASVQLAAHGVTFRRNDGRTHTIPLRTLHNHDKVRDAIRSHPRAAVLLQG